MAVATVQSFIKQGGHVYLQTEYLTSYTANGAFQTITNALGGNFTWNTTTSGNLAPMAILGTLSTTPNSAPSLSYFWYGCNGAGVGGSSHITPFAQYAGLYFGFIFTAPVGTGIMITTSDQDWVNQYTSTTGAQALMENILNYLAPLPSPTITLTSAAGTNAQTQCDLLAITPITYAIGGGGTGATVAGLPAGVTGSFSGSTLTISGAPAAGSSGIYTYTITATGPCASATGTGTITIGGGPVATLSDVIEGCNGGHTATVNVTGGISPYTFTLSCAGTFTEPAGSLPFSADAAGAGSCTLTNVTDAHGCGASSITGSPLVYPVRALTSGGTMTCTIGPGAMQIFFDSLGQLMASVHDGGTGMGSTRVVVGIDATVQKWGPVHPQSYGQRHIMITPATQDNATVCLYYTNTECSNLNTSSATDLHTAPAYYGTFATNWTNARMMKYDGLGMMPASHTTRAVITGLSATQNPTVDGQVYSNTWQVCFPTPNFSGFVPFGPQLNGDPLPVTLLDFMVAPVNNTYIQLNWSTATEINNSGFDVDRSLDGVNFQNIGWVEGHGNSTVTNNYVYQDFAVQPNVVYYYRLRQVDADGMVSPSNILSANLTGDNGFVFTDIVPNPANTQVSLGVISKVSETAKVTITDMLGRDLLTGQWELSAGYNSEVFDLSKFAAGTYTVTVSSTTVKATKRLVITR